MKFTAGKFFSCAGFFALILCAATASAQAAEPDAPPHTPSTAHPHQVAPTWWEQKLFDPVERPSNQIGWSVDLDDDTVMFGAHQTMVDGDEGRGAVHVFKRENGVWNFAQTLVAADGEAGDVFGSAIAVHGGVAAISSSQRSIDGNWGAGAVYLFEEGQDGWEYTDTLVAPGAPFQHKFGVSLALDDTTLAVASHTSNQVYLYERDAGGDWQLDHILTPYPGVDQGQFGLSISIDGERIAVGAPTTSEGPFSTYGSVWVFERVNGEWQPGEKLMPNDFDPNASMGAYFGESVSLQGDTVLVGARLAQTDGLPSTPGAAYVYDYDPALGEWVQTQKIGAPHADGQFGSQVALEGERAVITATFAPIDFNAWQGRAYVYERGPNKQWKLVQDLIASDGMAEAQFGFSLAFQNDTVAIGAVRDRNYIGAGYMYQWAGGFTVTPTVSGGGGSISPDVPQSLMEGTSAEFTLNPDPGHVVDSVGGSCGGSLNGMTFTSDPVAADCSVEVHFTAQQNDAIFADDFEAEP